MPRDDARPSGPRYAHPPFAVVPARAYADRRLNPGAVMVLGALCVYANQDRLCWPRQETLAELLGVTRQAVSKQIRLLLETGYLRTRPRGGRGLLYEIVLDADLPADCRRGVPDVTADPDEPAPSRNSSGQQVQLPVAPPAEVQPPVAPGATPGLQQVSTGGCTEQDQEQPTEQDHPSSAPPVLWVDTTGGDPLAGWPPEWAPLRAAIEASPFLSQHRRWLADLDFWREQDERFKSCPENLEDLVTATAAYLKAEGYHPASPKGLRRKLHNCLETQSRIAERRARAAQSSGP